MKKITTLLVALFATLTLVNAEELSGQKVFDSKCVACHSEQMPKSMKDMKAPPMAKISAKVKHAFDDNKSKVIAFIADYIENPSQEKVKCMAMAVKKFGLMPPIGKGMSKEEREVVATWVFDNFEQKWETKDCKSGDCKGKMKVDRPGKCGVEKCGKGKCTSEKPHPEKPGMKCGEGKCGKGKCSSEKPDMKCGHGKCGGK